MVTMGRNAERLFENACKMILAELCDLRQSCQGNFLREVSVDKFDDKLLLSGRQATAKRCRIQGIALPERMVSSIGKQIGAPVSGDLIRIASRPACAGPGVNSGSVERLWVTLVV